MNSVSPEQVRSVMLALPSWAQALPHIADDTPFPDSGLDSLAMLELVSELQRIYGVEIPDDDMEKVSTITDIAHYLTKHIA